jgi:hypothetical protein
MVVVSFFYVEHWNFVIPNLLISLWFMNTKDLTVLVNQVVLQGCKDFIQNIANLNLKETFHHVQNTKYMFCHELTEVCTVF